MPRKKEKKKPYAVYNRDFRYYGGGGYALCLKAPSTRFFFYILTLTNFFAPGGRGWGNLQRKDFVFYVEENRGIERILGYYTLYLKGLFENFSKLHSRFG